MKKEIWIGLPATIMLNKNLRSWKVLIDSGQQLPPADINFKAELSLPRQAHTKLMPHGYKAELSRLSAHTKLMPCGYKFMLAGKSAQGQPNPTPMAWTPLKERRKK